MKTKNFLSQSGGKPDVTRRQNRNRLGSVISRLSLGSIVSRFSLVSLICVLMLTLGVGNAWGAAVTIASWSGAARTADSEVAPTSSQTDNSSARLKSECTLSTAGTSGCAGAYYSTWTNGKCIYLTSLSLSGYTGVGLDISLRRRNGTCTAAFYASTDGSTYAASAWDTKTLTNSCTNYSVSVASNVRAIKIVIDGGSGNLWLGEVSLSGTKAASSFTVTYDGNGNTGGTVPTDATAYSSGATVTVKGNTGSLVKTGWTFAGWNTQADGQGTNYTAGSGTFEISENTTLYAKWTCTVTWSVNGSTSVYSSETITYNSSGNKVSSVPTPDPEDYCGAKFMGWSAKSAGTESKTTAYYDDLFTTVLGSPNITGNITFYAVFADYVTP